MKNKIWLKNYPKGVPENVNSNPYESGWMVKIELSANAATDSLLDSKSYIEMIG